MSDLAMRSQVETIGDHVTSSQVETITNPSMSSQVGDFPDLSMSSKVGTLADPSMSSQVETISDPSTFRLDIEIETRVPMVLYRRTLVNLVSLDLSNQDLEHVDLSLGEASRLEVLDISNNRIVMLSRLFQQKSLNVSFHNHSKRKYLTSTPRSD